MEPLLRSERDREQAQHERMKLNRKFDDILNQYQVQRQITTQLPTPTDSLPSLHQEPEGISVINTESNRNLQMLQTQIMDEYPETEEANYLLEAKIKRLEINLKEQSEAAYLRERDLVMQLETMQDLIKSKNQRLQFKDISEPLVLNNDQKISVELQLARYKIQQQDLLLKRLKEQKPSKTEPSQQTLRKIVNHIHQVTIDLVKSLEIVDPAMAKQISNVEHEKERLSSISLGFSFIQERIAKLTTDYQALVLRKTEITEEIKVANGLLENVIDDVRINSSLSQVDLQSEPRISNQPALYTTDDKHTSPAELSHKWKALVERIDCYKSPLKPTKLAPSNGNVARLAHIKKSLFNIRHLVCEDPL